MIYGYIFRFQRQLSGVFGVSIGVLWLYMSEDVYASLRLFEYRIYVTLF